MALSYIPFTIHTAKPALHLIPSGSEQHEVLPIWEYLGRNTSGSSLNSANRDNVLKKKGIVG